MLSAADAALASRDPGVPGLALLLNADAFAENLRTVLPEMGPITARSTYVRYKPGTSCLVMFHLDLGGAPATVYAKAYRSDDKAKLSKDRQRRIVPGPFGPGRMILEDSFVEVCCFPNDNDLKALPRLVDAQDRCQFLHELLPARPDLNGAEAETLRYKPERRFVARLHSRDGAQAVVKVYAPSAYANVFSNLSAFTPGTVLRVPRLLGRFDRACTLAFDWVPGDLLSDALADASKGTTAMSLTGGALAELHQQHPHGLSPRTRAAEIGALGATTDHLSALHPGVARRAQVLQGRLADLLRGEPDKYVAIHGDFNASQVVLDSAAASILDLDHAALGDPMADLGSFLARLEWAVLRGELPRAAMEAQRSNLLESYERFTGCSVPDRLNLYFSVALLLMAAEPFRYREADWPRGIEALVARAEVILEASTSSDGFPPGNR